jgi:hypothetical protein
VVTGGVVAEADPDGAALAEHVVGAVRGWMVGRVATDPLQEADQDRGAGVQGEGAEVGAEDRGPDQDQDVVQDLVVGRTG